MLTIDETLYDTIDKRWALFPKLIPLQRATLGVIYSQNHVCDKIDLVMYKFAPQVEASIDNVRALYLTSYGFGLLAGFDLLALHAVMITPWNDSDAVNVLVDIHNRSLDEYTYSSGHKNREDMLDAYIKNVRPKIEKIVQDSEND